MADLSRPDGDRGQIILIAGFVLAVTFVALALILNSVIFTENLATRSESVGGSGPAETRDMLEQGVGDLVTYANRNNFSDGGAHLKPTLVEGIRGMDNATAKTFATRGQIASIRYSDQTNGTRFFQNDSAREFRSAGAGGANWTLNDDIVRTRAFTFAVNASEVASATSCPGGPCFRVNVTENSGSGDTWGVAIYEDATSGLLNVTAYNETGVIGTCQNASTGTVRVDVTDGRIDSDRCSVLNFGEGVDLDDPYEITYVNGDAAAGNYSVVVRTDGGLLSLSPLFSSDFNSASDPPPYAVRAVYAARVNMTYITNDLTYEIGVRVAPGEPE